MPQKARSATLQTGATVLDVIVTDESQVVMSGTFGSVALTDPDELEIERTITSKESFRNYMSHMRFRLTGVGPVKITVYPQRSGKIAKFNRTP